jgi:hypothetical protein
MPHSCLSAVAKVNDAPEPESDSEGGDMNSMPPNLEEFIPGERLPDMIDVHVNWTFLCQASGNYTPDEPTIKFVRQCPRRTDIDKGMFNTPS